MGLQEEIDKKIEECETYVRETLESVECENIEFSVKYEYGQWECEISADSPFDEEPDERTITCDDIDDLLIKIKEEV